MYAYVCVYVCVCSPIGRPVEGIRSPGDLLQLQAAGNCAPLVLGAELWSISPTPEGTQVFFTLRTQDYVRIPDGQSRTGTHSNNFARPWGCAFKLGVLTEDTMYHFYHIPGCSTEVYNQMETKRKG